jgi:6-pyruvoyl-tetrahydropterin synthase
MKTELILGFNFEASHSLSDYEQPHLHLWRLECTFSGKPIDGRILDMVQTRARIETLLESVSLTYLNENQNLTPEARRFPTCETLTHYFKLHLEQMVLTEFCKINSTIQLRSISVSIGELNGLQLGSVRLVME